MQLLRSGLLDRLDFTRRPADYRFLDLRILAQPEMQATIVLCGKACTPGNFLLLLLAIPKERNLRTDRATIAGRSFQLKLDPLVLGRNSVFVNQQRSLLIGDDNVEHATIPEVGEGYGPAVIGIRNAHSLGNIDKLSGPIVQPHALVLISRQAAAFECRPILGVADNRAVAAGYF